MVKVNTVRIAAQSCARSEQVTFFIQWPVKLVKLALMWCANAIGSFHLELLTSLTLLTTPQPTTTLQPLIRSVILHVTTTPFTLSHSNPISQT